jgi:LCP family protein required for cell wall assembly
VVSLCVAVLILVTAGITGYLYHRLDGNIDTDTGTESELAHHHRPPPGPAENVLLIGTDSRGGPNGAYGSDTGSSRSDTVILLHISDHRRRAVAVSVPRDLMVDVPGCLRPDGTRTTPRQAQFNWSYSWGGAACTILTVEQLTGVRVDHHLTVDFAGFKTMVDAVNGVEVCVPYAVHDDNARLDLPAGRQILHGEQALGYVRARHVSAMAATPSASITSRPFWPRW